MRENYFSTPFQGGGAVVCISLAELPLFVFRTITMKFDIHYAQYLPIYLLRPRKKEVLNLGIVSEREKNKSLRSLSISAVTKDKRIWRLLVYITPTSHSQLEGYTTVRQRDTHVRAHVQATSQPFQLQLSQTTIIFPTPTHSCSLTKHQCQP